MENLSEVLKRYRVEERPPRPGADTSSSANLTDEGKACAQCGGIGWLRRDLPLEDPDFGKLVPCRCRLERLEAERYSRLLRIANLGTLGATSFEQLAEAAQRRPAASREKAQKAVQAAAAYAERPEGWLVLTGPGGSGKTRIAAAIAHRCLARGTPVFFIGVADLLDHLRSAYAPTSETTYDELFEQVKNVPVLVLDDLGEHSATQWAQEKLSQLLGHRYNARSATVVTTSLPLDAMDDRLRARLQDTSLVKVVELGGAAKQGPSIDSLDLKDVSHMTLETFNGGGKGLQGDMRENLEEAKKLAKRYAEDLDGWLVFFGRHGCGKTHLAAAIAHERKKRGDDVLFILVPDLLDYLRATFQPNSGSSYQVLDRVKRVGLLILDDYSEPVDTGWTREKLYQILNFRYLARLPTVITLSVDPEKLEERIWSRMGDSKLTTVYRIMAPDYREPPAHLRPGSESERPRGRPRGRASGV